jgi:hypothetical protein
MDTRELLKRGLTVRREIFGADAVEQRMGSSYGYGTSGRGRGSSARSGAWS